MTESSIYAMRFNPPIIAHPSTAFMAPKKVMDGLIHSAMMTPFQTRAIDGLIRNDITPRHPPADVHAEGEASFPPTTHTEGNPRKSRGGEASLVFPVKSGSMPYAKKKHMLETRGSEKKHHEERKEAKHGKMSTINKDIGMVRFPGSKY
jgi:hypothetical protein